MSNYVFDIFEGYFSVIFLETFENVPFSCYKAFQVLEPGKEVSIDACRIKCTNTVIETIDHRGICQMFTFSKLPCRVVNI